MAEEATRTPLDGLKDRLAEAKKQRGIAEGDLSKAKQNLVEARRASRKIIAAAKKEHAAAKMEVRIREDEGRLERLPREGWGQSMLRRLLKVKIAYLERRSARTRQTAERLREGTGQLDESASAYEDEQKDVEKPSAIEDVEKKRKELEVLTDAHNKKVAQAAEHIFGEVWKNLRKKRQAVRIAASDVNSEALKFPWKRVADNIVAFGRWAGFAGVAGCFYASAVSLGAIFRFFYFRSTGINIFSYAESVDFLAPGYVLVAFFVLTLCLGSLIPLAFYHLVKLIVILPLPLYAEILAAVLPPFAKWVSKSSIFVLCCTVWLLFSLLGAVGAGYIWPSSQDCVSIVTDPPFQYQPEYIRIGSTSKYLFLREEAGGCPVSSRDKTIAPNNDDGDWNLIDTIKMWLGSVWAGDRGKRDSILVVPLSQITCISETTGNGEGLCRPAAVKSPPPAEDPVDQHIANDMGCCPGKLDKSIFFSFVHDKGEIMDESPEQTPRLKKDWKPEVQEFVQQKNGKAAKWRVYGFASLDGLSADNDDLSRQRAETVRDMLCDPSETWSSREKCQEEVEIRYLGENHLVTAGPKSQSAVIAVCERVPEQSPEKATTPVGEPVPSSG